MRSAIATLGVLLLALGVLGCGPGDSPKPAPPPSAPVSLTCPVCGGPFARDRGIDAGNGVTVCSDGCAIRHSIAMAPPALTPDSRAAAEPESQPDEDQ